MTYAEAAKLLKVSQRTLQTIARDRREIPIVRVGHSPRLRLSDILSYIDRGGSSGIDKAA